MGTRIRRLLQSRALGAAVSQLWQAVGSFGLQIVAAWTLGAVGLGLISLSLGVIVLTTALASGMIGDSLVILDRSNPKIRGALQGWALLIVGASAVVAGVAMGFTVLTPGQALLFGAALAAFQIEELVRRVFMGLMQFWKLVILDSAAVFVALGIITATALLGGITVGSFFAALLVGQLVGIAVGVAMLPSIERTWAPIKGSEFRTVGAFGSWRGAQVAVPQLMMTLSRILVTAFAGGAMLGLVEGARILVAPVLLTVQGLGAYLLSSYVRDKALGVVRLRRRAWRASSMLMGAALVVGALVVVLAGPLGHLISGPDFSIERLTVIGWVAYVIASASLQPFASLAAVLGRQRRVFLCRLLDAASTLLLLTAVLAAGVPAAWTPFILAAGLAFGGILVRAIVLAPLAKTSPEKRASEIRTVQHV